MENPQHPSSSASKVPGSPMDTKEVGPKFGSGLVYLKARPTVKIDADVDDVRNELDQS